MGILYEIPETPNLLKIIHRGGDLGGPGAVQRQVAGDELLRRAGLASPRILEHGAQPPFAIVENIFKGQWAARGARLADRVLSNEERAAVKQLYEQMGDRGLVWLDGHRGNVFFYQEGGRFKAGVLDQDFIYPYEALNANITQPETLWTAYAVTNRPRNILFAALNHTVSVREAMTDFFETLYP